MVVFSNRRLGPAAELLVSYAVAAEMLRETANAAHPLAAARWEIELVHWLHDRSRGAPTVEVGDIAWTPDNFERQRRFVLDAIETAARTSEHSRALARWAQLIEAHPRDSVQFGRRWIWQASA